MAVGLRVGAGGPGGISGLGGATGAGLGRGFSSSGGGVSMLGPPWANLNADIRHGGNRAYYAEGPDYVQMPPFETFIDAESHAATLAHEITHWTKHDKRLARDMGRVRHGDEGYAREELVAELGAAFLCADLEIQSEPEASQSGIHG